MSTRIRFNGHLMAEDAAARGWTKLEFARAAGVSDMTVIRFLRGDNQTPPTAARLSNALGYTPERYLIRTAADQVS